MPKIQSENFSRSMTFSRSSVDADARTVEVAFSSEIEVERWFGIEILDHSKSAVDLSRLNSGGAVLLEHERDEQVGVVVKAWIDSDRVGRAILKISRSQDGEDLLNDIIDGIRTNVSVNYSIDKYEITKGSNASPDVYRVLKWTPKEISFVSVPADITVGVGRSEEPFNKENQAMPEQVKENQENQRSENPVITAPAISADQIRQEERARVADISRAASECPYDLGDLGQRAIDQGMNVEQFRAAAFEIMAAAPRPAQVRASEEMFQRENQEYSLARALNAQLSGDWSQAGFEREMSEELARNGGQVVGGGLLVPTSVFASRADTGNGAGLIATKHMANQFIDVLRANTLMGKLGARFLTGLQGNVSIPKKTKESEFGWLAEKAEAAESDVTVGNVTLSPKHIGGVVPMTFELMRQSSPVIEQIVREDMLTGIGLAIDLAAFSGSGKENQPLGLLNQLLIQKVELAGATPTFEEMVLMEGLLDEENALMGNLHYAMRPSLYSTLKTTKKDAGSGLFVIENGHLNGYKAHSSTQLPANTAVFGNFSDVMIGTWGTIELIPFRNVKTGGLDIGVHQMCDVAVRHAKSFVKTIPAAPPAGKAGK